VPGLFENIRGFRAAFSRVARWHYKFFQYGLKHGRVNCLNCGQPVMLHLTREPDMPAAFANLPPAPPETYGVWMDCAACNQWGRQSDITALAQNLPEVQLFWREHPHMMALPPRPIEAAGVPALVTSFQDVTGPAQIDVVLARSALTLISIQRSHHE
jgi:hypothetical protein